MYRLGIDLGGTNIAVGVVDQSNQIVYKDSVKTPQGATQEVVTDAMVAICKQIMTDRGLNTTDIRYIGIGVPGIADDAAGKVIYAPNVHFDNFDLRGYFTKQLDVPVYMENDANAAALGESLLPHMSAYKNVVFVTLGTGVGVGVTLNNQLIRGNVEAGHITIDPSGPICGCGNAGCFESFSSATALIKRAKEKAGEHPESKLLALAGGVIDNIEAKTVFDAYDAGDACAIELFDDYISYLAIGINNLLNSYPADAVILGGGVSKQEDKLIQPLTAKLQKLALGGTLNAKIFTAKLGNDAGILGAANLNG